MTMPLTQVLFMFVLGPLRSVLSPWCQDGIGVFGRSKSLKLVITLPLLAFCSPISGAETGSGKGESATAHNSVDIVDLSAEHPCEATNPSSQRVRTTIPNAVVDAVDAVYVISYNPLSSGDRDVLEGGASGFFIAPNTFVTNAHAISYDREVSEARLFHHSSYGAMTPFRPKVLLSVSWLHDLAVIQTETDHTLADTDPIALSPASATRDNDLYLIGYPTESNQIVEAKICSYSMFYFRNGLIRAFIRYPEVTDALHDRRLGFGAFGASGSPVVNSDGDYVGVFFAGNTYFAPDDPLNLIRRDAVDDLFGGAEMVQGHVIVAGDALAKLIRGEIGTRCGERGTRECVTADMAQVRTIVNDFISGKEFERRLLGVGHLLPIVLPFEKLFDLDSQHMRLEYLKAIAMRFDDAHAYQSTLTMLDTEKQGTAVLNDIKLLDSLMLSSLERSVDPESRYHLAMRRYMSESPARIAQICEQARSGDSHVQYDCAVGMFLQDDEDGGRRWLQAAADQGHADAQYQLGFRYHVEGDEEKAVPWLKLAMEQGHEDAQRRWLSIAAGRGSVSAMYALGSLAFGEGDTSLGVLWYERAAEEGHAEAQYELAVIFLEWERSDKAAPWLRMAAEQGHGDAQYDLGTALEEEGKGDEAVRWYMRAAEGGHVAAQYRLGTDFYGEGKTEEAVRWLKLAAGQGNAEAQNDLGVVFLEQERSAEAIRWFEQAAEQGLAVAQNNLGGVLRDEGRIEESVPWFKLAAEQGDADAQFNLGVILLSEGKTEESVPWFRLAAERGDADALYNLGLALFMQGETEEAARWLKLAADGGSEEAQTYFGFLIPRE